MISRLKLSRSLSCSSISTRRQRSFLTSSDRRQTTRTSKRRIGWSGRGSTTKWSTWLIWSSDRTSTPYHTLKKISRTCWQNNCTSSWWKKRSSQGSTRIECGISRKRRKSNPTPLLQRLKRQRWHLILKMLRDRKTKTKSAHSNDIIRFTDIFRLTYYLKI